MKEQNTPPPPPPPPINSLHLHSRSPCVCRHKSLKQHGCGLRLSSRLVLQHVHGWIKQKPDHGTAIRTLCPRPSVIHASQKVTTLFIFCFPTRHHWVAGSANNHPSWISQQVLFFLPLNLVVYNLTLCILRILSLAQLKLAQMNAGEKSLTWAGVLFDSY